MATLLELPLEDGVLPPQPAPAAPPAVARVLHVINGEHYSGAERVQDLLALRLAEHGYAVGFACLKPGRFASLRQSQSAPLVDVPMAARWSMSAALTLAGLIRRDSYALVHTHTPRAALVGSIAAALGRVPLVHHLHSPTTRDSTHRLRNRLSAAVERLSLSGAAAVVAVSHSLGQYALSQRIAGSRIAVVPNGVPSLGPLDNRRPPRGTWTLGTVALFRPRKGLEVLLDALAILLEQGLSVKLRAVGAFETAEYEAKVMEQVERLSLGEAIDSLGFTKDVTGELAKMDLFVLPSLFGEGLPMVVLEAMAAGVPVVGTRVEGVPEAIRDEVDGLLAAPGDPQDLAAAIARLVRGQADWSALRASAHTRQAEQFSDASMAAGVARVYDQVLNR